MPKTNKQKKVIDAVHVFSFVGGLVLLFVDMTLMPSDVIWLTVVGLGLVLVALCLGFRNI